MTQTFFIAGTDTGIGKTTVAARMLKEFSRKGFSTLGIKPVASGCDLISGKLRNDDALTLHSCSSIKLPYEKINPIAFAEPIAPHIAALKSGESLSVESMVSKTAEAMRENVDVMLVEGVGGWCVPLNDKELMSDFVKALGLKVILVVGMRVGCLNHAIQTFHHICNDNIELSGWIANCIDPNMDYIEENVVTLERYFSLPCQEIVEFIA